MLYDGPYVHRCPLSRPKGLAILEYIYHCMWRCTQCGEWFSITPLPWKELR